MQGYPPPPQGPYGAPPQGYGPPPGYPPQGAPPGPPGPPHKKDKGPELVAAISGLVILLGACGLCSLGQLKGDRGKAPVASPGGEPGTQGTGWHDPQIACRLLHEEGLYAGIYKTTAGEWGCTSQPLDLGGRNAAGLSNSLRFFAEGQETRVAQVKLFANVNVPAQGDVLQRRMTELAATMTRRALGAELPAAARAVVAAGQGGAWTVAGAKVAMERDAWPTGKGYSLRFTIE